MLTAQRPPPPHSPPHSSWMRRSGATHVHKMAAAFATSAAEFQLPIWRFMEFRYFQLAIMEWKRKK